MGIFFAAYGTGLYSSKEFVMHWAFMKRAVTRKTAFNLPSLIRYSGVISGETLLLFLGFCCSLAFGAEPSYSFHTTHPVRSDYAAQPEQLRLNRNTSKPALRLQGGISVTVPRTPEQVASYLAKMRKIVDRYDQTVAAQLMGAAGLKTDSHSIELAKGETIELISQIRSLVPPAELKTEHEALLQTMEAVNAFFDSGSDGTVESLKAATELTERVHTTLDRYHAGVLAVMSHYKLPSKLDPFAGENEEMKSNFAKEVENFKTNRLSTLRETYKKQDARVRLSSDGEPSQQSNQENLMQQLGLDSKNFDLKELVNSLDSLKSISGDTDNLGNTGDPQILPTELDQVLGKD